MVKPIIRENAVEAELINRVRALGGIAEKVTTIGNRGFFDRLVVLKGRVIFVEVKKPAGGRISPHQILRHARYKALGAEIAIIKNSSDIDALLTGR